MKQIIATLSLLVLPATMTFATPLFPVKQVKDTTEVKQNADSTKLKSDERGASKSDKKEDEYEKLIKKGGSFQQGLFNVRHIEKDWYFDTFCVGS